MNRSRNTPISIQLRLTCFVCILVILTTSQITAQASLFPAVTISFGSTTSGSINTPGEVDTYTFTANSGDNILIGMSRVSGNLWQRVRLYDPEGTLLRDEKSPVHVEISQILPTKLYIFLPLITRDFGGSPSTVPAEAPNLSFTAGTPGTYTILVSDGFDGTLTGSYSLYLQKLNPPVGATNISLSQTLSGNINQPAEMDTFTFSTNAGDVVLLGMSRVSGNLWQKIRLYDPNGTLLNEVSSSVHSEMTHNIPVSGTYTILVADGFDGTLTGSYNLYLQKLNPPAGASIIAFSQTVAGAINQPAEMDAFTFSTNAGDKLIIGMSRVSGSLWQKIRLYDPNGTLLYENSSPVHAEMTYPVPITGTYAILVGDGFNGTLTGSYNIFIQRTNNPANATAISFGQTQPGSINLPAEMDTFTFGGNTNDNIQITMTRVSGSLWQKIRIYDPSGNLLGENSGPTQAQLTQSLPSTGIYTLLASDGFDGTLTGSYNVTLQQLP